MFDVFGSVKGLLKLDSVAIDNTVFRMHYKATVVFLVVSSLLVTSKQYIGDPIDCIVEGERCCGHGRCKNAFVLQLLGATSQQRRAVSHPSSGVTSSFFVQFIIQIAVQ